MPIDKDRKRLVRARMAATGESYTQANAALMPAEPAPDLRQLVRRLADPAAAGPASMAADSVMCLLKAQPPERLVPALVAGLQSPDWRVRRNCCRLLDDLDFTAESLAALQHALDDPDPRVRRAALHTLSCEHCKPSGCALDIQPLFERMAGDPSRRVRDAVLNPLGWQRHGDWAERLVERMAADDPSEKLREHARRTLAGRALERAADQERRRLPEELRRKTDRHPFEWIAVDGERLIAGSAPKERNWDLRRWLAAADATATSGLGLRWYFVLPD